MRRREILALLGGAVAWPPAADAQQRERVRRIGVLTSLAADDPESPLRIAAFLQALEQLGWTDRRKFRIEYRWGAGDVELIRKHAAELAALAPDVILANATSTVALLHQATRTVLIVFVNVASRGVCCDCSGRLLGPRAFVAAARNRSQLMRCGHRVQACAVSIVLLDP